MFDVSKPSDSAATAAARGRPAARSFGRRPELRPFSLVVDLAQEPVGPLWLRGAATLALLCGSALMLAPGLEPFGGEASASPAPAQQVGALMLPPLAGGEAQPVDNAPMVPAVVGKPEPARVDMAPSAVRLRGQVSDGLYWSLREAGVSPQTASEYLQAIATRIDVGEVAPFDRFDLVVAREDGAAGSLLYAGLSRAHDSDVQLMKWTVGGKPGWYEGSAGERRSDGLMSPVAGRITSGFGNRVHPIFRFSRFHSGVDFGAGWGSPVVAAADGQVSGAGWNGGYGRQVRVTHAGGLVTTYSHLSGIAAAPGAAVRQGQVIGYVGSTGVSTGPHLHFEVHVGGRAVNPLAVRLVSRPLLEGQQLAAFKARLKQLQAIGENEELSVGAAARE